MSETTQNQASEIFRHLRPQWFNRSTFELENQINGGISFGLTPFDKGVYDFWIYICPLDTPFSAKQAVKSIRSSMTRGIIPWGQISLGDDPLIDQLINTVLHVKQESTYSSVDVQNTVRQILVINQNAAAARAVALRSAAESAKEYSPK